MREPKRVVHVIDTLRPGGAERLLVTTLGRLDRTRFRPLVVSLFPILDLKAELEAIDVPVYCVAMRGPRDWWRGVVSLATILRRLRPHIVHTHLRFADVYARLASVLAGRPSLVTTLHHENYTHWSSPRLSFRLWKRLDRFTARHLNGRFVAVSEAVRRDYLKHFGALNCEVIHNCVDVQAFRAAADAAVDKSGRQEFGWSAKEFVLVQVGRFAWEKGQSYLVDAMPGLVEAIPEARLLFVGDGPDLGAVKDRTRALEVQDVVAFAGNRHDVPRLLALADVVVVPSIAEGFGIVVVEAMAAERPVVASRIGGMTEIIVDGVNGLLVSPADASTLAEAVLRLYRDRSLRQALTANARMTVERHFHVTNAVRRLEAIYGSLGEREEEGECARR